LDWNQKGNESGWPYVGILDRKSKESSEAKDISQAVTKDE